MKPLPHWALVIRHWSFDSALLLLVFRVGADHANDVLPPHDLAVFTDSTDARTYFHQSPSGNSESSNIAENPPQATPLAACRREKRLNPTKWH